MTISLLCVCGLTAALAYFFSNGLPLPGFQNPLPAPGPQVTILEPFASAQVSNGNSFLARVAAQDEAGVVRIDLYVDDQIVLTQTSPDSDGVTPLFLSHSLTALRPGVYSLSARAYNAQGAMGQSFAVHVTITDEQAAQPQPRTAIYVAEEGDTLAKVAEKTGKSLADIQNANPGVQDALKPGQNVDVPPSQQGQQSQKSLPNQFPVPIAGAQVAILPVFVPGIDQGLQAFQPDQIAAVLPNAAPDWSKIGQAPGAPGILDPIGMPAIQSANATGCQVSLAWEDRSSAESGFAIYRRLQPAQPAAILVKVVAPNTTSFVDEAPYPGVYIYEVEAMGKVTVALSKNSFLPQQQLDSASRSAPRRVEVKTSECHKAADGFKFIYFQPIKITGTEYVALWYSLNDGAARRVPGDQGQYNPAGAFQDKPEALPLPASLFLNPNQAFFVKIWALGHAASLPTPLDLGMAYTSHLPAEILGRKDKTYVAQGAGFLLEYKIWIEDAQWTGQGTTDTIPAPTNLRQEGAADNSSRLLTWDWQGNPQTIDGYILYRSYSCPGMETQIRAPQMIPASRKKAEIPYKSEPARCTYRYQVSAYGRAGESPLSNALEGDTQSSYAIISVTFKEIKFNNLPVGQRLANMTFFANRQMRSSTDLWIGNASRMDLSAVILDGRKPNHSMSLTLTENEAPTVGFSVSGVDEQGYAAQDSVCKGSVQLPEVSLWLQQKLTQTIRSADNTCELTVELELQAPQPASGGGIVRPTADINITMAARAGGRTFVKIVNQGPDDLPSNHLAVSWIPYTACAGKEPQLLEDGRQTVVRVESNLPQWIHLDDYLDGFVAVQRTASPTSNCLTRIHFIVSDKWGSGSSDFIDPNPANNKLWIDAVDIPQMP